jgi:transposase
MSNNNTNDIMKAIEEVIFAKNIAYTTIVDIYSKTILASIMNNYNDIILSEDGTSFACENHIDEAYQQYKEISKKLYVTLEKSRNTINFYKDIEFYNIIDIEDTEIYIDRIFYQINSTETEKMEENMLNYIKTTKKICNDIKNINNGIINKNTYDVEQYFVNNEKMTIVL